MVKIDISVKEVVYYVWFGYYNLIREIGRDKILFVNWVNRFSDLIGL